MLLALLAFLSMAAQDAAAAAKIELLSAKRRRPWLAGGCEAVNDVGAVLSVGIGGYSAGRTGASVQTVEILVALALAAVVGTVSGDWLSNRRRARL